MNGLRHACNTGDAFTGVILNRRKSGDRRNRVDLEVVSPLFCFDCFAALIGPPSLVSVHINRVVFVVLAQSDFPHISLTGCI